ncbi:hypothetical protein NMY22_g1766 [Coprinellus aureogranulatus]|nr:hypothetical protein NMY22_g1766 [Coprinellus aureogranulatus]
MSIALVHASWSAEAQQIVFKEATTHGRTEAPKRLTQTPDLIKSIRHLSISLPPQSPIPQLLCDALAEAIALMSNLQSLTFSDVPDSPQNASAILPRGVQFPRLEQLNAFFAMDENVIDFLARSPHLTHLSLYGSPPALRYRVPPDDIKHLTSFTGPVPTARDIVIARPISHLVVTTDDLTAVDICIFSRGTVELKILDAKVSESILSVLQSIEAYMPHIQHVQLLATYEVWDQWPCSGILIRLKHLETANISGMFWRRSANGDTLTLDNASASGPQAAASVP